MSASSKKKLRKEENAAAMTDRQRQEAAESRKLKAYTISFVAVILVVVIAAVSIWGVTMVKRSGVFEKKTIAATIDGQELNSVEMNYYFTDAVREFRSSLSQYGDNAALYASFMGFDMSKPLDKQAFQDGETTWADNFWEKAFNTAKYDIVLEKKAKEEGFTLTEEQTQSIDMLMAQMQLGATQSGYTSVDKYLAAVYGPGSNSETYRAYLERSFLASAYLEDHKQSYTYEDADIREFEKDKFSNYSSFTFADYYVSASDYLEGGTTAEDGTVSYSDEEKAASVAKAKEVAEALAQSTSVEELDKAIAALDVNKDKTNAASTKNNNVLYTSVNKPINEWIADSARKEGEIGVIENKYESEGEDGETTSTVSGYYVVLFQGRDDNQQPLANVRHLLVKFKSEQETGTNTFTDEEKAAAKKQAEDLLAQWQSGDATEDSFIALVKEKSEDLGSKDNGGLIEDISPASPLVESFRSWAIDPSREAGDTDIVESPYGYHVMYYSGDSETTYRDMMLENDLRVNDTNEWLDSALEAVSAEKGDLSRIHTDMVLATSY